MIGKIKNLAAGKDLLRLNKYLSGAGNERIAGFEMRNLAADNLPDATLLMEVQAGLSLRAKRPIAHLTISYAPSDRMSNDQMMDDADRILYALGAQNAQAVIVVHDDKDYQHFHVVFNRVDADGRCISDSNSKRKIETILRQIESERGLRPVSGRHALVHSENGRFKGPRAERRGYVQPPEQVVHAMRTAKSRQELDQRLAALGWRLEAAKSKPGQKTGGLSLKGPKGAVARASDCGRACSGPALVRRFSGQTSASSEPIPSHAARTAPFTPRPNSAGVDSLVRALKKAKATPRLQRIAPVPTATGIIKRIVQVAGPRIKF